MPPRKPPPGSTPSEPEPEDTAPELEDRVRTPKYKKMEISISGLYIVGGSALTVLPNDIAGPNFKRIGKSLVMHSGDIADAWVDLAEDDPRVRRMIESLTGFSAWGKVVGRHLEAFGDDIMPVAFRPQQQEPQQAQPQPDEMQAAMVMAQFLAEQAAQQRAAQEVPNGQSQGPTEQQLAEAQQARARMQQQQQRRRPMRQQQQQPIQQQPQHPMGEGRPQPIPQEQAPPMGQTRKPVGMPTPADLGVQIADSPEDFPAGGSQDVRG